MTKALPQERNAIVLTCMPHERNDLVYQACWSDGRVAICNIPEIFIDLLPFMAARVLLEQGFNPKRRLIVRLQGADYELLSASLGSAAATPLINKETPVKHAARNMYARAHP
jgi:hypothetical protein